MSYRDVDDYHLFISGSHSKVGRRYPNAKSDIDVYIVVDKVIGTPNGLKEDKKLSYVVSMLFGMKVHLFIVSKHYLSLIEEQLEELK